jgi:hypothetical protein
MRREASGQEENFRYWIRQFLTSCPKYEILNTKYLFKNCNIFTIVGSEECRVMSGKWKSRIKILTSWILTAFFTFVPKMTGERMGAAFSGRTIGPIQPLPLDSFSPTSEIPSPFLPSIRHTIYNILLLLGAVPKNAHLWSSPTRFWSSLTSFRSSLTSFWSSLKSFRSSPERFCPDFGGVLPRFWGGSQ